MMTQFECIALLHSDDTPLEVETLEEVGQHLHSLSATHQLQARILLQHPCDECRMVGFHVMGYQIVWLATIERSRQVSLPLLSFATIGSIHHSYLVIVNQIGIITHALRHNILALKEIDVEIVNTDILDGISNHIL